MFVWTPVSWSVLKNQMTTVATAMVAAFGITGILLVGWGVRDYLSTQQFLERADVIEVEVVGHEPQPVRPRSNTSNERPIVAYQGRDGEEVRISTGNFSVIRSYEVGDKVMAYVDLSNPDVRPVIRSWWQIHDDVVVLLFAGVSFVLTAMVIFLFAFGLVRWEKRLY